MVVLLTVLKIPLPSLPDFPATVFLIATSPVKAFWFVVTWWGRVMGWGRGQITSQTRCTQIHVMSVQNVASALK